jgi:antibiotic biosynthesis monooxygenase (ABM) superfamily enzyme
MKIVVKNFKDDEKLLDIKNWTHSVERKAWIFKIEGKVFGEFSEV